MFRTYQFNWIYIVLKDLPKLSVAISSYALFRLLSVLLIIGFSLPAKSGFDPGLPTKLNHVLPFNERVQRDFEISPSGETVIYRARQASGDPIHLFSVSIRGGTPRNITPDQAAFVTDFKVGSDSKTVVYQVFNSNGTRDLWTVEIPLTSAGGIRRKILTGDNADIPTQISGYLISQDNSHVIYRAKTTLTPSWRLYSSKLVEPIESPIMIAGQGADADRDIDNNFQFVPDENRVVFRADLIEDDQRELFVTSSVQSSTPTKVSLPLIDEGDVSGNFQVSPNGSYVVYTADARINDVTELYSTTLTSLPIFRKLNPNNLASNEDIKTFQVSSTSENVVYISNERNPQTDELFSVPINNNGGSQALRISGNFLAGGEVISFTITENGARVVFAANLDVQLFSTPIRSQFVSLLSTNIFEDDDVVDYKFNNSGSRVVYRARKSGPQELFSVRVAGGDDKRISPPLVFGGNVLEFKISPVSDQVFYRSDQENADVFELFGSKIQGPVSANQKFNTPLAAGTNKKVDRFAISADGRFLVYSADQQVAGRFELYSVEIDIDGFCVPIRANNGKIALVCL